MTAKTLLIGNGPTAQQVAAYLTKMGATVTISTTDPGYASLPESVELLTGTVVEKSRQTAEGFDLTLVKGEARLLFSADCIVLCDEYSREPLFDLYGLTAGRHVASLSRVIAGQEGQEETEGSTVFLTGLHRESSPLICREVMETACRYADRQGKVYILTENLKVAGTGLEALYRTARRSGVIFIKFNREKPDIGQSENGKAVITFRDEITGHRFRLTPALTVVDEMPTVSELTSYSAETLGIQQDGDGFAQADNVHRLTVWTNRRGILSVGPSRGVMNPEQQSMDIHNAVLDCLGQENESHVRPSHAEVMPGCVRCLTCYRSCPFGAIAFNSKVRVVKERCEGCGICVAECPQKAIRLHDVAEGSPAEQVERLKDAGEKGEAQPAIYAFCCSRSAAQAAVLARKLGHRLPSGLKIIQVPCTGLVATGDILKAFQERADGVLVLTCHEGNCHAEKGNLHARRRAEGAMDLLAQIGLEKKRLRYATLAANMAHEFSEVANSYADTLKNMGLP